jgi:Protein of unknown function (DUF1579)
MMKIWVSFLCALTLAGGVTTARAQEQKKEPAGAAAAAPMPKPGPEHDVLKKDEGVWDATVEATMAPGTPPAVSKGVETVKSTGGGLWYVNDFKSEMMGQPFEGHGVTGYDPIKKKYVGTWVDSMSSGLSTSEASYDPATKTMTAWMEGPDMSGKVVKMKAVTEWKDADTRVFTLYQPGPDGKEIPGLKITYKRRK